MLVEIKSSANKDVKKLPKNIKADIKALVLNMMDAKTLNDLTHLKKLKTYKDAYRIRVGDYRLGFFYRDDKIIISRILHRKEVYRYFP
ncbi:MAG: type II toxin-antitoxin system RelE/ParE family toxin [Chitinophagales bacterium]|nr:type II toxin-antitoxin system RelE/ParE family toxin [Chitinophagales bacterium]MCZ2393280.1 type II toxin-antitoxin system RelE/ParE family toxin [Chitinophagales bacterium]